ncbi:MAG TPA: iron-containing redox enzyme family protein [Burkholderiaceae bacterium]|nr:iron-containing redox enzyme family protein [Burkholderiaceae bacterium]
MSFFIRLLETTDANRCELEGLPKIQEMLNGKMTREEYKAFLIDLYHIVWHFCPIMAAAASRCPDEFKEVRYHLYHSIEEEKGHETMVLNDLKVFGISAETVQASVPSYAVQAMLGYNYYTCERIHPCSVAGMLYGLELISSVYSGELATSISLGLDMPLPHGFTFLDSHSAMDLDHVAELRKLFQTIHDPHVQEIIINAIQMNFYLFTEFMKNSYQKGA